jgi:signal peptidase I
MLTPSPPRRRGAPMPSRRALALARYGRWPRPLALFALAAIVAVIGSLFRPLIVLVAVIWGGLAAAMVLDARLRGRRAIVTGVVATLVGPLGCVPVAFTVRNAVRKVGPRFRHAVSRAVMAGVVGGAIALVGGFWTVSRVVSTAVMPMTGMAPRIAKGDLIVISPLLEPRVHRGDIVAIGQFAGARRAGLRGRVIGVGRVIGLPGDWIGATADGVYLCVQAPDITADVKQQAGCLFPDESGYTSSATPAFGPVQVPPDSYYVLGDDREVVSDSRLYGAVPASAVQGGVVAVVWPPSRIALR